MSSVRYTEEQFAALAATFQPKPKRNKYGAVKTQVDGIWFDSKAEAAYYDDLKLRQAAGLIVLQKVHPQFPIVYNSAVICIVELDFQYLENGTTVYTDVKGKDNDLSRLKRKLVEAFYSIVVEVVK